MNKLLIAAIVIVVVLIIIGIYMYTKSSPPKILSNDPPTTGPAGAICQGWSKIYPHLSFFVNSIGNLIDSFNGLNTDFHKTANEAKLTAAGYNGNTIIIAHVAPGSGTNSIYNEVVTSYNAVLPAYTSLSTAFSSLSASIVKYSISANYPSSQQLALDISGLNNLFGLLPSSSAAQWYAKNGSMSNVVTSTWSSSTQANLVNGTGDSSKFAVMWTFIATCYYMMNSTADLDSGDSWLNGDPKSTTPSNQGWKGMKKILNSASGLTPYNGTSSGKTVLDCYNILAGIDDGIFMPMILDIASTTNNAYSAIESGISS